MLELCFSKTRNLPTTKFCFDDKTWGTFLQSIYNPSIQDFRRQARVRLRSVSERREGAKRGAQFPPAERA